MFSENSNPNDILGMKVATSVHSSDLFVQDNWMAENGKVFKYLMNIYKASDSSLYGLMHIEDLHNCGCPAEEPGCAEAYNHYPANHGNCTQYSLALARCDFMNKNCDEGGWQILGEILPSGAGLESNIGGGAFMTREDGGVKRIYVYFNQSVAASDTTYGDIKEWISVARARLDSVLIQGAGGNAAPWAKFTGFDRGNCRIGDPFNANCWTEDPIGGVGGMIPGFGNLDAHTDMAYSPVTSKFYMPVSTPIDPTHVRLDLWSSSDGITFGNPVVIANELTWPVYPTIVPRSEDWTSDDGSKVDSIFYVHYIQILPDTDGYGRHSELLYRKVIHLKRNPAATVDYDGDGISDISVKLGSYSWIMDFASNGFQSGELPELNADMSVMLNNQDGNAAPGDYDGDRFTDIALKTDYGDWKIDYAKNGFNGWDTTFTGWWGAECHPVPADYDGDGTTDISVFCPFDTDGGYWAIDSSRNGFGSVDRTIGNNFKRWDHPVPGDFNGDGRSDLAFKSDYGGYGTFYADTGDGTWRILGSGWGDSTYKPAVADFDGDGKADLAVLNINYGQYTVDYQANGFGNTDVYEYRFYTGYNSLPVPSDYDGDGIADMAVKDENGSWGILFSASSGNGVQWYSGWGDSTYHPLHKPQARVASILKNRGGIISFSFTLSQASPVRVVAYSVEGKQIGILYDGRLGEGANHLSWSRKDLSDKGLKRGMYFLSLQAGDYKETKRLGLVE